MRSAYPKLFAVGSDYIPDLFKGDVEVTEKVDGSQFSFGNSEDGDLQCRSKGKEQDVYNPDKMFTEACEYIRTLELPRGWWFYCEYLQKPRHSTLAYDRIPKNHLVLFGVSDDKQKFLDYEGIKEWAAELDIDAIPLLYSGKVGGAPELVENLERPSYLGGQLVEGVVVKRYEQWMFANQPMPLMGGKYVSEAFKEVHKADWKKNNTGKGKWETFKEQFKTQARWDKAIMHLAERGELEWEARDIPKLLKEVHVDITDEESERIKTWLWKEFGVDLLRYATNGLPQYYKERLLERAFEGEAL